MSFTILIVDDEENARFNIGAFLTGKGYDIIEAATLSEARSSLMRGDADIILLDVRLPDGSGSDLLQDVAQLPYRPPVIMITAYGEIDLAVQAMRNGAHDFLSKPIQLDRLEQSINHAVEVVTLRREIAHLRQAQLSSERFVLGQNPTFRRVISHAQRAAKVSASCLITGETGTGKEVLARFIHRIGPRADKPFIAVNCAAIQNTMLESELFGYEAGAFTGAERRKLGLMEVADTGVLFLDEISSMPLDIQAKLLRAIDERAFRRVGGTKMINVDVQILAASNRDLHKMLDDEKFRSDLYFRLKVVDLHVPPLRERREDIPELVGYFIRDCNGHMGMNVLDITQRALDALKDYSWPGNIRELSNAVERAMLFCDDSSLELCHFPSDIVNPS
jgi:two-component system response regulator AtoC